MNDYGDMTAIDWKYGRTWEEFPMLRKTQLMAMRERLIDLVTTVPTEQLVELSSVACMEDEITIASVIRDMTEEIQDLKEFLKKRSGDAR